MSGKRGKLTADNARERIGSLEESVRSREQKLHNLKVRIARASDPEEKLLKARERLERRLQLEREQLQKLKRLLSQRSQEVSDDPAVEELDDLHRSFEEVRQDLTQVKRRLENTDIPRDLPSRLSAFEERISRREEADSGLFSQLLDLQSAIEQERQNLRKLSRRNRERDQSLEALREAVEDSVVATVDLAERLEELEESISESSPPTPTRPLDSEEVEELRAFVLDNLQKLEQKLQESLTRIETLTQSEPAPPALPDELEQNLQALAGRLDKLEFALSTLPSPGRPAIGTLASDTNEDNSWVPATFCASSRSGRVVASFSPGFPGRRL
jgi:chromosome segregation ATPase